jgi:hypothetical protein
VPSATNISPAALTLNPITAGIFVPDPTGRERSGILMGNAGEYSRMVWEY